MIPALMLNLLSVAHAGDFLVAVGPEVELMNSGTWARAISTDSGWKLAHASNGDFYISDLTKTGDGLADWELNRDTRRQLTFHGELKDHAIKRCPDGTYLHLASANVEQANDSAYGWRYSADWEVLASNPIEEREPARAHNDMTIYCSALGAGVAFGGQSGPPAVLTIDSDLNAALATELPFEARPTGGSMWTDNEAGLLHFFFTDFPGNINRMTFDADWSVVDSLNRPITTEADRAYWPQGLLRIGDYWLIAHMVRPQQTQAGGDDGNVRLIVLNDDLEIQDEAVLTDNPLDAAGMRPWLARKGDQVIMSYDRQRQHTVIEIRLDLATFGVTADDDTGWDGSDGWGGSGGAGSGSEGDSGDEDDDSTSEKGCDGCASGRSAPVTGLLLGAPLLAAARRRRSLRR